MAAVLIGYLRVGKPSAVCQRETNVKELCRELGISRQTLTGTWRLMGHFVLIGGMTMGMPKEG